jgi:hypothetical protein
VVINALIANLEVGKDKILDFLLVLGSFSSHGWFDLLKLLYTYPSTMDIKQKYYHYSLNPNIKTIH